MDLLDSYLRDGNPIDQRDIDEIQEYLESVVQIYIKEFDNAIAWPYEIKPNDLPKSKQLSQNTTAMILSALLRFAGAFSSHKSKELGNIPKSNIIPLALTDKELNSQLLEKIKSASILLLKETLHHGRENDVSQLQVTSKTFGCNDVFTLAWLAEVGVADWMKIDEHQASEWHQAVERIFSLAKDKLECSKNFSNPKELFNPPERDGPPATVLVHAFPALRLVQIIRQVKGSKFGALSEHYKYFETSLHEQLSFSSIPDSRFDPAELMFCLEGMLLCQKNIVDRTLFDRVLSVLTSGQNDSPYWRPVKPYLATPQGLVLFPVSVEIANSLLRACAIFDEDEIYDTYSSKCIPLLRRYWQWLRARAVKFQKNEPPVSQGPELVGWHSEHVNDQTVIHLWETSQVIEFLLSYRNVLYLHIARTTLLRSRFTTNDVRKIKEWKEIESEYEPVTGLGEGLCMYKKINEYFVRPHREGRPENYSMLLYGPPGTGKTTVAESIAQALGHRLITITVSDFLAEGGAQVEARAKNIFEVLKAQTSCVVLFDEIDHFLLDRDSERYGDQETVFQFMTPGMLTKLNDLRRVKRSLFIVATNYEDRIDAAIKRTGRIDHKFIVLPPDQACRNRLLRKLLGEYKKDLLTNIQDKEVWKGLETASLFLGYKDIEAVVRSSDVSTVGELEGQLTDRARTISLESYGSRFHKKFEPRQTPMGEFLCLTALLLQVRTIDEREKAVMRSARDMLKQDESVIIDAKLIQDYAKGLASEHAEKVAETLLCLP